MTTFTKRYRWEDETTWVSFDLGKGPEEDMYQLIVEAEADGWQDRYTPYTFPYIKEMQRERDGEYQFMQICYDPYDTGIASGHSN